MNSLEAELHSFSCELWRVAVFIVHQADEQNVWEAYAPFVPDAFMSLVGSDAKVPVTIFRDKGAYDSFKFDSVLPLSGQTDTGECVLSHSSCSYTQYGSGLWAGEGLVSCWFVPGFAQVHNLF